MNSNDSSLESVGISLAAEHPLRILVVEDNTINLHVLLTILRRFGYEPLIAKNGLKAVEIYKATLLDCIFMDMHMPKMNGLEATTIIRDIEYISGSKHPVFISALTADASGIYQQDFLDAGINDYLSQPISRSSLAEILIKASTASKK
ncbi:MAG: response regulator [Chthoniobacterales bacterium]